MIFKAQLSLAKNIWLGNDFRIAIWKVPLANDFLATLMLTLISKNII